MFSVARITGRTCIKLPRDMQLKNAVLNLHNDDNNVSQTQLMKPFTNLQELAKHFTISAIFNATPFKLPMKLSKQ